MSISNDFQKLTNYDNLYLSYLKALRGKSGCRSAAEFNAYALENICKMKRQLIDRTYKISPYAEFVVTEPKRRIVKSGAFRDKVLQHCLCDFVLLPKMKEIFIEDNYAGQIGKGTHFGLDRLSHKLTTHYQKYGCNGYILKCDITKFFYSIDHIIMKRVVHQYFPDEDVSWVCDLLIDSSDGGSAGMGLALGNQSSQVFALMYLNELDHLITEDWHCSNYGRYMDDFFIISHDKDFLKNCLSKIMSYLDSIKLTLNHKTEIVPIRKGIRFLGFHTYLTSSGKIIRKLTGDNKRQAKRRLRKQARLVKQGKMSQDDFYKRYQAWCNHISYGNCYNLRCNMDAYVQSLLN